MIHMTSVYFALFQVGRPHMKTKCVIFSEPPCILEQCATKKCAKFQANIFILAVQWLIARVMEMRLLPETRFWEFLIEVRQNKGHFGILRQNWTR